MLFVDTRWRAGTGGIQRYAEEVILRLGHGWRDLERRGSPYSVGDFMLRSRRALRASDVLYSPGFNAGITPARQVVTVHDLIHLTHASGAAAAKHVFYEKVVRPAARRSGVVLTVSETSRIAILDWLRDPSVRVINTGNGCSRTFSESGPAFYSRSGYLLYVGATRSHKNFDVLLQALAIRPDYQLIIVSHDIAGIRKRAALAGVGHQVQIFSNISDRDLAALYRGSQGLVFPSLLEGFGLPAVEAMRCGKRVAYWVGCAPLSEIVGRAGPRVENAASAEEWAAAMDDLMNEVSVDMSELLRRASRYEWDSVAARVRRELPLPQGE